MSSPRRSRGCVARWRSELDADGRAAAVGLVQEESGVEAVAPGSSSTICEPAGTALGGVIPSHEDIVFERFFDESGGMQLIVHAPLGARVNRALGLGLRKKFCLNFDFELQAAASNDAVLLSLGPQHSFPLEDVPAFLRSHNVQDAVSQAVLRSPMFTARWRWNLNRSLAVLRRKGGRLNPFNIQRMESDDLMAAIFPALAACQDNAPAGPVEIPEHLLVRETMGDCLHEAMDIEGLKALVRRFEQASVRLHFIDTVEPSVLAHEILNGAPFTFLDEDSEIGERRSRAVPLRRGLPVEPRELGRLDPDAIARVRAEASPEVRDPDELHDVLLSLVASRPRPEWAEHFVVLSDAGRAFEVQAPDLAGVLWGATERRSRDREPLRGRSLQRPITRCRPGSPRPRRAECRRCGGGARPRAPRHRRTRHHGRPRRRDRAQVLVRDDRPRGAARAGLCDRGELRAGARRAMVRPPPARPRARVHARPAPRRDPPISQEEWEGFLQRWWHAVPGTRLHGRAGVAEVIEQLQGFEWPAGDWERLFAERVESYRPEWLDDLCLSGRSRGPDCRSPKRARRRGSRGGRAASLGQDPLAADPDYVHAARGPAVADTGPSRKRGPGRADRGLGREVLDALRERGAQFHPELQAITRRMPTEVEEGLWDGVARGLVTADGFNAVRSLLQARTGHVRRRRSYSRPGSRGRRGGWRQGVEGRWTLLPSPSRSTTPRSWRRRSPRSSCCAGAWSSATSTSRSALPSRGGRSSGRCAASRPAA